MTEQSLIYHEDLQPDHNIALGERTLSKAEIITFGRSYDPQPMHIDEEAAKATLVGGLCASGFHTCAVMMRMACDGILNRMASLGSPGVEEVLWKKPVRPDEPYHARYRVLEKRDLASRRDVGLSRITVELFNSKEELAASWISIQMTRRRSPLETLPERQSASPRTPLADIWSGPAEAAGSLPDGYFEDRQIGETVAYPPHTFERGAIIDFARQFDPQPFHLDDEAAKASLFGALCASGWHTAAIFIRSIVSARMQANAAARANGIRLPAYGPSPGFRDLRWFKPVFVGDTVEFRSRISRKVDLKSRPERGLIVNDVQGRNQKGEVVFAITSQILAERHTPYRPA
ncbi:MAG: MaoC family dehydratase [Hyphomicrobiales bacterium]|nr:MAG: MaoC family dehydratase [Hyphomicrobiales bacterium]